MRDRERRNETLFMWLVIMVCPMTWGTENVGLQAHKNKAETQKGMEMSDEGRI